MDVERQVSFSTFSREKDSGRTRAHDDVHDTRQTLPKKRVSFADVMKGLDGLTIEDEADTSNLTSTRPRDVPSVEINNIGSASRRIRSTSESDFEDSYMDMGRQRGTHYTKTNTASCEWMQRRRMTTDGTRHVAPYHERRAWVYNNRYSFNTIPGRRTVVSLCDEGKSHPETVAPMPLLVQSQSRHSPAHYNGPSSPFRGCNTDHAAHEPGPIDNEYDCDYVDMTLPTDGTSRLDGLTKSIDRLVDIIDKQEKRMTTLHRLFEENNVRRRSTPDASETTYRSLSEDIFAIGSTVTDEGITEDAKGKPQRRVLSCCFL